MKVKQASKVSLVKEHFSTNINDYLFTAILIKSVSELSRNNPFIYVTYRQKIASSIHA